MGILADSSSPVNRDFLLPSINFAPGNAVYEILAYFMFSYGTGMILLANPNSHFSTPKSIDIMRHFFAEQQIGHIDSSLLSLVKLDCISEIRDTPYEADYFHY